MLRNCIIYNNIIIILNKRQFNKTHIYIMYVYIIFILIYNSKNMKMRYKLIFNKNEEYIYDV